MNIFKFLFTGSRYDVKPARPYTDPDVEQEWLVLELTTAESFLDDWGRYGLRVAWFNLVWLWKCSKDEQA